MRQLSLATGLALSILFLCGGAAQAIPFVPNVDLRAPGFQPPGPVSSFSHSSGGYNLTIQALKLSGSSLVSNGTLFWDSIDGYGLYGVLGGYDLDEIETPEVLGISFGTTTFVDRVLVADLFLENGYYERGSYSVNGGSSWTTFTANNLNPNGEVEVPVGASTQRILFTAPGKVQVGSVLQGHEYSVVGLDLRTPTVRPQSSGASAPEPGAALLFGVGLALLRRRAAARA